MEKVSKIVTYINERIAVNLTLVMSTMWMVYAFLLISVLPFFVPEWKDIIGYISSSVLQLVSLPLIMVGSNILSRAAEKRSQQDHDTLMAQHAEMRKQISLLRRLRENEKDQSAAIGELSAKIDGKLCDCTKKPSDTY